MSFAFRVLVRESLFPRDPHAVPLAIVGELDSYSDFEAIARHNIVGAWTMDIPAQHPQAKLLTPGRGVVVFRDGSDTPSFSGPIRKIHRKWNDAEDAGAGTLELSGVCDNVFLAERLAWTNPAADIHLQGATPQWMADLKWKHAGELLYKLLKANTQGHTARRGPPLYLAPPADDILPDESAKSVRLKFARVDELASLLASVYNLSVRCMWHPDPASVGASNGEASPSGPGLVVTFSRARDLSQTVRFSVDMGNLKGFSYSLTAPEATRLVIGTQNRTWFEAEDRPTFDELGNITGYTVNMVEKQGPERWFGYYSNRSNDPYWWGDPAKTPAESAGTLRWAQQGISAAEVEWGMTAERFKDRRDIPWQWAQDPARQTGWQLDPPSWSAHYRALADEAESFSLTSGAKAAISIQPIETPRLRYHFDYTLGDRVTAHLDGSDRSERVSEIRLSASASDGPRVQVTLGSQASETPYLYRSVRDLWLSLGALRSREDATQPVETIPKAPMVLRKAA
ncbi:hypothetical protein ACIBG8_19625 [Nonomuraea sp. NPDC050556]|uniref:Gp37-like protein n=1 Tax=Nonomuraea sp. NPDC050556 TaxID=3364369 RepID=UPI0037874590